MNKEISKDFNAFILSVILLFLSFIFCSMSVFGAENKVILKDLIKKETKVIVHYKPKKEDETNWALWLWPKDGEGEEYPFTSEDQFGKIAVINLKDIHKEVGIIVKSEGSWDNQDGGDHLIDTRSGVGEVWLHGGDETELFEEPKEISIKKEDELIIHYYNPSGYYNASISYKFEDAEKMIDFTAEDEFGKVAKLNIDGWKENGNISLGINTSDNETKYSIHPLSGQKSTDIWLVSGDDTVYYNPNFSSKNIKIDKVTIEKFNQIKVQMSHPKKLELIEPKLTIEGITKEYSLKKDEFDNTTFRIETKENLDLTKQYLLKIDGIESKKIMLGSVVRTKEFDEMYAYDGDLGIKYDKKKTLFKLWAPTAESVELITYEGLHPDSEKKKTFNMDRKDRGVYQTVLTGNQENVAYAYHLTFGDGSETITSDPYARAVVANGERSVVENPEKMVPNNFGKRMPSFDKPTDATIYELHVRDFSIAKDSGIKNKGKFLGVIEEGTKTKSGQATGLDYLKELGVSHIQFLPMYDYASVDETDDSPQFNWGYDPKNYNVPEGSYSTDPYNPTTRIIEMKEMIQGLHDNGLRVIMDVVYNHVYSVGEQALDKTVPGYYFRYTSDDKLANGTGVGNDTASERVMMRRYIVDSISYWAKNFNLDGFRFDLMGIHDVKTMNEVRKALDKIDPSIIILGEGWDLETPLPSELKATQKNANKMTGIAHFNDALRDSVKGSVFEAEEPGFVNGGNDFESNVAINILGGGNLEKKLGHYKDASQVVQYVEAHDNLTLFDKLSATNPNDNIETRMKRHMLATSIPIMSQGVPFIHAGQEFMRTKNGNENSYNSPDEVNQIDWNRVYKNEKVVKFVKELIALRQSDSAFRLTDFEEIESKMEILLEEDKTVAYKLDGEQGDYLVVFNASEQIKKLDKLPVKDKEIILSNQLENEELPQSKTEFLPLSVTVLKSKNDNDILGKNNVINKIIMVSTMLVLGLIGYGIYIKNKNI